MRRVEGPGGRVMSEYRKPCSICDGEGIIEDCNENGNVRCGNCNGSGEGTGEEAGLDTIPKTCGSSGQDEIKRLTLSLTIAEAEIERLREMLYKGTPDCRHGCILVANQATEIVHLREANTLIPGED
jgi:hypothetical protein